MKTNQSIHFIAVLRINRIDLTEEFHSIEASYEFSMKKSRAGRASQIVDAGYKISSLISRVKKKVLRFSLKKIIKWKMYLGVGQRPNRCWTSRVSLAPTLRSDIW
jgi:hypothetical protein